MRVTVLHHLGSFVVDDLDERKSTAWDLKRQLWGLYKDKCAALPSPTEQTLVFNNAQLVDCLKPLQTIGIKDGSLVVMLSKRREPASAAQEPAHFPSAADVERLVRAEGERQVQEVTVAPESTPVRGRARMEAQLQEVMEALQGLNGALPGGEAQERIARLLRSATIVPSGGAGGAIMGPVLAEEVTVPEPSAANLQTLADMGFSIRAARRALLLNRNVVNNAANYLVAHGADGDIEAEPSEAELRAVYRAQRVRLAQPRPPVEPDGEHLELLTSMGFAESASRHALVRHDNDIEAAINLLTAMPVGWEPEPEPTQPQVSSEQGTEGATGGAGVVPSAAPAAPPAEEEHDGARAEVSSQENSQARPPTVAAVGGVPPSSALQEVRGMEQAAHAGQARGSASSAVAAGAPVAPEALAGAQEGHEAGVLGAGTAGNGAAEAMHVLGNFALLEPLLTDMGVGGLDGGPGGVWDRGLPRSGSAHMAGGALPILSSGGAGDVGVLDQFGFDGEMRWPSGMPGFLGGFVMGDLGSGELGSGGMEEDESEGEYEEEEDDEVDSDGSEVDVEEPSGERASAGEEAADGSRGGAAGATSDVASIEEQ